MVKKRLHKSSLYPQVKEVMDVFLGVTGTILLSPVLLGIGAAIALEDGFPVLFTQKRVGKDGSHFMIYKFRTMKKETPHDCPTHLLNHPEQYITRMGGFLRKYSLDELPQLINIAKGDMAIVGPRPALWNQYDLLQERDKYGANDIKPGLTGWAQIHGRDELEIKEKAALDGYYKEHLSLLLDIRCLAGTVFSVIRSEGVVEGGTGSGRSTEDGAAAVDTGVSQRSPILIVTNHSYMFYQFRKELVEALMREQKVILSTPFVGHEEDLQAMGLECIETPVDRRGMNPVHDLKLLWTYWRILKKTKPSMVLTFSIKPNIYMGLLCSLLKIPYCTHVQGLGTAFQNKKTAFLAGSLYRMALHNASVVFFENKENAKIFVRKHIVPSGKVRLLKGAGVNLSKYPYQPYPESRDKVHFLYLGRLMKEKGIDELLDAVEHLYKKYPQKVVLDIVGFFEEAYKDRIENLEKKGIVVFHGFQENPISYYAKADCVVLPSYHEGMSNVLLEAAATGRPLITSDIAGCREAVIDGKSGYLCRVRSRRSLYQAMQRFMKLSQTERIQMGQAGRRHMEVNFDRQKVVAKTVHILHRVEENTHHSQA